MENSTKQVDSCKKLFALLKLLLEDNATFSQVVQVISDDDMPVSSDNSIHSVTLNKYLNTLKLRGLNVKKEKGRYHLINPPYKIDLNKNELSAFWQLKECASSLNDDAKSQEEFEKFLKSFELRFSEQTQMLALKNSSQNRADFSFYYDKFTNKVDICSKFCKEDYKVEIIYYTKGRKKIEKKIIANAQELLYRRNSVKLHVLDLGSHQTNTIPIDQIISIKQLPGKITPVYNPNRVVVFAIKGRLAKNYRLREWEYVENIKNGWTIIVNKDEDEEELTERILKYGASCKIIQPTSFKDKILSIFEKTLKLYE